MTQTTASARILSPMGEGAAVVLVEYADGSRRWVAPDAALRITR